MNLKQQSAQKDRLTDEQFGFVVGEYVLYKFEVVRIVKFTSKWSVEILVPLAVGAARGAEKEEQLVSILDINKIPNEKK